MVDCTDTSVPHHLRTGYSWTACLTIFSVLLMLSCFALFPRVRGSTAELLMWRGMSDLAMGVTLLVAENTIGTESCVTQNDCKWYSLILQFTVMASCGWFLTLSLELMRAVRNPFSKHAAHPYRNHSIVWGISGFFTLVLWITESYGVSSLGVCWIKYQKHSWNTMQWLLVYIPTVLAYLISVIVLVFVARNFNGISARSHVTRMRVLREGTAYVIGFCIYWTALGILYAADYSQSDFEADSLRVKAIVCILGLRGAWDFMIWLKVAQLPSLLWSKGWEWARRPVDGDEAMSRTSSGGPSDGYLEVMIALRRDLMLFTARGIYDNALMMSSDGEALSVSIDTPIGISDDDFVNCVRELDVCNDDRSQQATSTSNPSLERRTSNLSSQSYQPDIYDKIVALGDRLLSNDRHHTGKFEDYAPRVFKEIRRLCGLSSQDYCTSFTCYEGEVTARMNERFSEGKSGMFLYFTENLEFMVKQMDYNDYQTLCDILPEYHDHLRANPSSLIMRVYGCHAITLPFGNKIYFGVFQNIFSPPAPATMQERYDLKGSTVARRVLPKEFLHSSVVDSSDRPEFKQCLKDTDWRALGRSLHLAPSVQKALVNQVRRDTEFFKSMGIMDYSLLVGVSNADSTCCPAPDGHTIASGVQHVYKSGDRIFSFGIIDILQRYTCKKFAESCSKQLLCKGDGISCRPPEPYADRFSNFCQVHVFGLLLGGVNLARRAISLPTDSEPKRTSDPKKRRSSAPMSGQGITQLGQHSKDHLLQNSDDPGERLVPHGGEEVGEPLVQHSGDQEGI